VNNKSGGFLDAGKNTDRYRTDTLPHLLHLHKLLVKATQFQQLFVITSLNYFAFLQHNDFVGMTDGAEAVCNYNAGSVLHHVIDSILYQSFTFGVQ